MVNGRVTIDVALLHHGVHSSRDYDDYDDDDDLSAGQVCGLVIRLHEYLRRKT